MFSLRNKRQIPPLNPRHRLAVLLPVCNNELHASAAELNSDQPPVRCIRSVHVLGLIFVFGISALAAETQGGADQPSILKTILIWTPLLLKGFGFNILISFMAMAIGTVIGAGLGVLKENTP